MDAGIRIVRASHEDVERLADVLVDVVEGGASVGFMLPITRATAQAFFRGAIDAAVRGERIVLVAEDASSRAILGTVQLVTALPQNQPHRGDVAKLLVSSRARRRGVGAALVRAIEDVAREENRSLLVLDTVTGSDAERLYARLGWVRVGTIPGYALFPDGTPCATTYFYRDLGATLPKDGSDRTPR